MLFFGVVAILIVAVGAGLALVLPARRPLQQGRDEMLAGRDALLSGDAAAAGAAFDRAEELFADAEDRLGNPLTRLASFVPIAGRIPDAVTAGAEAGVLVARAGALVAGAAEDLPGGVGALAPRDGVIPVEPFRRLTGPLSEARSLVAEGAGILDGAPRRWVPGVVGDAVTRFEVETHRALRSVTAAAAISRVMPAFLGADEPKRYLVAAQNPAELRGTGGLVGSYATLTVEDGAFELSPFRDVVTLSEPNPSDIDPPNPDFGRIYDTYLRRGAWSNANMTADVPAAATMFERVYQEATGEGVDGTILADPLAFARLIQVSGPQEVPGTEVTVDADSVVPFVTNEAYSLLPGSDRKQVLGSVAGAVLDRFLASGNASDPLGAGLAIVEAAGEGHLLFHATDPEVQAGLQTADVAGALPARGDLFAVVANNAGANKIDFYADRSIQYSVDLLADGWSRSTARVRFENNAPASGQPPYVIGPYEFLEGDAAPGENLMLVSAYCGRDCRLQRYLRDGQADGVEIHRERGYPLILSAVRIPSGEATQLEYHWSDPTAWQGDEYGGSYRLTVRGQPTIRPTPIVVDIGVPPGMRVVRVSSGVQVEGDRVRWSGTSGEAAPIEVEFERRLFGIL